MEDMDDLLKMMTKGVEISPRIVQQKEDVIYIKNPHEDWALNRVLNFKNIGLSAITLCLQEHQAIALMLSKST